MVTCDHFMAMDLDIDLLIREIKSRPALWDAQCATYNDRTERIKMWEQVVDAFFKPTMSATERRELGICLQKKWRNLRDSFAKERRRLACQKDDLPEGSKKREYVHYDSLLFLKNVITVKQQKQAKQERKEVRGEKRRKKSVKRRYEESDSNSTSSDEDSKRRRKSLKHAPLELRVPSSNPCASDNDTKKPLLPQSGKNSDLEDADRCFMLSLLEDFKSLPPRLKPIVKINIMKCIMEAQDFDVQSAGPIDVNPLRFSPDNAQRSNDGNETAVNEDTKPAIDF